MFQTLYLKDSFLELDNLSTSKVVNYRENFIFFFVRWRLQNSEELVRWFHKCHLAEKSRKICHFALVAKGIHSTEINKSSVVLELGSTKMEYFMRRKYLNSAVLCV